jgi:hypothetical protein
MTVVVLVSIVGDCFVLPMTHNLEYFMDSYATPRMTVGALVWELIYLCQDRFATTMLIEVLFFGIDGRINPAPTDLCNKIYPIITLSAINSSLVELFQVFWETLARIQMELVDSRIWDLASLSMLKAVQLILFSRIILR